MASELDSFNPLELASILAQPELARTPLQQVARVLESAAKQ